MKKVEKNWIEWMVFAFSAALLTGVIGFLVYESVTVGNTPPDIHVVIGKPEQRTGYFAVPIVATNKGDHTAEGVHVELVLRSGSEEETGDFEIQFLPRQGAREAWVTFKKNPAEGTLEARVLGYEKP